MDYELRIVVEKVAISSQEVIPRDTITSYALQCPTSIVKLGRLIAGNAGDGAGRWGAELLVGGSSYPTGVCDLGVYLGLVS